MAEQEEVLKYKLDISDAQAKMQALEGMLQQLKAKKAAGEDTGALETQINKEIDGLGRLTQKEKQAGNATEDLVRQKDKLGNVVQLVGGQFGGMVGQLGGVIELLTAGGVAASGFAGGLAALAIGVKVYQDITRAAKEAADEQERLNGAIREAKWAKMGDAERMAQGLDTLGALTPGNLDAAQAMKSKLMESYGMPAQAAQAAAVAATGGGVGSVADAAVISRLQKGGADLATPAKVQAELERAREEGVYDDFLAKAAAWRATAPGEVNTVVGKMMGKTAPRMTPTEHGYEALRIAGKLPADMSFEEFREGTGNVTGLRDQLRAAESLRATPRKLGEAPMVVKWRNERLEKTIEELNEKLASGGVFAKFIDQLAAMQMNPAAGGTPDPTNPRAGTIIKYVYVENVANKQVSGGGDKRMKNWGGRMGPSRFSQKAPHPGGN